MGQTPGRYNVAGVTFCFLEGKTTSRVGRTDFAYGHLVGTNRLATMDVKRLARSVDKGVLRNPWVARAGSVVFLGNVVRVAVQAARGADVLTVLTVVLFTVGVVLMVAPLIRRWMDRGAETSAERGKLISEFSAWVRTKRAALPDWPAGSSGSRRGGLREDDPVLKTYKQTSDEVNREARVEYHERFRERVLARLGEGHEQASDPRKVEDLEALDQLLKSRAVDAVSPTDLTEDRPTSPTEERRPVSAGQRNGVARTKPPATTLAERLAQFYREGERLRRQLWIDLRSRETFDESRDEGQTERHRSARAWNQAVISSLYREEGWEFKQQWDAAGSIPDPHPTLALVEPTISFGELIRFMDDKLACLKGIIKALGDPAPDSGDEGGQ